ncbi:MAG: 16S rRNA (guanine(527)-N(7))-methyltransferase RsmG [Chlorobi bacterium]|nr:16S rRNA (guanine(527)-N(7))-methyltransferase RsmG [Chlorobiota bacterium]
MEIILKYFPNLSSTQIEQFSQLQNHYTFWNSQINVISRKDIGQLYLRHVLHSLSILKIFSFVPNTQILDVGTGGGFPGIPLAILYPEVNFLLIDSIGKKIKVVENISSELKLSNIQTKHQRVENIKQQFDFVVSRAVTAFPKFAKIVFKNISSSQKNKFKNGIIYLKGGDFNDEIKPYRNSMKIFNISDFFEEDFFETKKIIYLPKL